MDLDSGGRGFLYPMAIEVEEPRGIKPHMKIAESSRLRADCQACTPVVRKVFKMQKYQKNLKKDRFFFINLIRNVKIFDLWMLENSSVNKFMEVIEVITYF